MSNTKYIYAYFNNMISSFLFQLLQNFDRKQKNQGFTLIELLVVVIILVVLAAIALPNLLGQVAKGRQAEATSNLGTINRAQQAYRLEKATFGYLGGNINLNGGNGTLTVDLQGKYYRFSDVEITGATPPPLRQFALYRAVAESAYDDDILDYSASVSMNNGSFASVICEEASLNPEGSPNIVEGNDPVSYTDSSGCAVGNKVK